MKNLIYKHTWKFVKVQVFSAFYNLNLTPIKFVCLLVQDSG